MNPSTFFTMLVICFIGTFLTMITQVSSTTIPTAAAIMFYSTQGNYAWNLYSDGMAHLWSKRLEDKLKNDMNWPFNGTVELVDIKSNSTYMKLWAKNRLARTDLPPVSVFMFNDLGYYQMPWFEQFKIPCLLLGVPANEVSQNIGLGVGYNYTFLMKPAAQYAVRSLADKYVEVGVKSVVSIANLEDYALTETRKYSYSYDTCIRAPKNLMVPRGIQVLDSITYLGYQMGKTEYANIIKRLNELKPDAVMICDIIVYLYPTRLDKWIVKFMQDLDYTPKAMFVADLDGRPMARYYAPFGTLDYITQATYTHPKLTGIDYTENDAPYSSQFRASTPIPTVAEDLLSGSNLDGYPSSAKLYYNWFKSNVGYAPSYLSAGIWAGIDIVEQAFWRGGMSSFMALDGVIDGTEMYELLMLSQAPTPYGRVTFDPHRINTQAHAVMIQFAGSAADSDIVAPSYLATHEFVYPMPTWKERYYEWSLMKGETRNTIAVAGACSALLIVMMITLTIFREERDIKMLYYPHVMILMMMVLTILWALVFVWQGDVNQAQCDSLLWTIFLPASFVIQLVNMKAYRLSVFLTSESKTRMKKFTHHYVMKLTLGWVAFTAILLLAAQFIDPPTKRTVVLDKYRPSQDYNVCSHGDTTNGILFFLFAQHLFMAICCVAVVRNGMEGFKDGMVMKEAFTILFACIAVAFVMDLLGLESQTNYFMRTAFVGIGFTFFGARLLMSRCARHWVTQSMAIVILKYYKIYQSFMPQSGASEAKISAIEMYSLSEGGTSNKKANRADSSGIASQMEDDPTAGVTDGQDISEMMKVFSDEQRMVLFKQIAEKGLLVENVDFLMELEGLSSKYATEISASSKLMSSTLKEIATQVFDKYIVAGSEQEVNVSHSVRKHITKKMETWPVDKPLIPEDLAETVLREDVLGIATLFKSAEKEISHMLYQNIWNKFRTAETEINMQ